MAAGAWRPRRVLVVARWYPAHDDPGRGSFVSDEVAALQALGIEVVVASWENADVHAPGDAGRLVARQAVAAWRRAVMGAAAVSTPRHWGAGVPVARLPAVQAGDATQAPVAIEGHAALLVPFATALAERWPFDLVHAHVGIPDGAVAARVARAAGVPLIVTEHASTAPDQLTQEAARRAYLDLLGPGRRLIAVSHALAARLEAALGAAPGSLPVVPNIVPLDRFPLGTAEGRDPDELLWVGARREGKGIETLLRAVALARGHRPGLHLRLVGRAPDDATEMRWRALAAELGLGEAIAFDPPADRAGVAAAMRHAAGAGWRAVEIPYIGGSLAMTVIVPDDLATFEAVLTADQLASITTGLAETQVSLTFPKFSIETKAQLADVLAALGMPTAVAPYNAAFSGITDAAQLFISDVIHQANIDVDEKGTEAAAATAVVMRASGIPAEPVTLRVDRPFLFALRDVPTGAILFLGRVADPSITR